MYESDYRAIVSHEGEYWALIEQLQALGERFGCPAGMDRVDWLRARLAKLERLEDERARAEQKLKDT